MRGALACALASAAWLALAAAAWLALAAPAAAGGRGGGRKQLKWDNFRPKGLGINVAKPTTLKMKKQPSKQGYLTFTGTDTLTHTKFTLHVRKAGRTAAQLKADLLGLTGIAAAKMIPLMSIGAVRGFKWQQTLLHRPVSGMATAVLIARHGKRSLSYVIVVRVRMGVAVTYLTDFKKAYFGLKAIP